MRSDHLKWNLNQVSTSVEVQKYVSQLESCLLFVPLHLSSLCGQRNWMLQHLQWAMQHRAGIDERSQTAAGIRKNMVAGGLPLVWRTSCWKNGLLHVQEQCWLKETLLYVGPELVSLRSLLSAPRVYQHSSCGAWSSLQQTCPNWTLTSFIISSPVMK